MYKMYLTRLYDRLEYEEHRTECFECAFETLSREKGPCLFSTWD